MTEESHSQSLSSFEVVNVVSSTRLDRRIDIETLSKSLSGTQYEPRIFPGLVYRRLKPKATIIMFASGKIVSIGTKSEEDSRRSIRVTISELTVKEGTEGKIEKIKTENVVAVSDLGFDLDLEKVVESGIKVIYEPGMFPGAICRTKNNISILLFKSGKLVLAGSKSQRDAKLEIESMTITLRKSDCLVARLM
jgi:transcription initiation factor TFIID TATA-box-binding protein